jgi:hypothetical protein
MDEGSTRFEEGCLNDALALELILFDDFGEARDFPMIGGSSKREQTNNGGPSVHLAEREREFQEENALGRERVSRRETTKQEGEPILSHSDFYCEKRIVGAMPRAPL